MGGSKPRNTGGVIKLPILVGIKQIQTMEMYPIPSMGRTVYLPIHEWWVFMINVGEYIYIYHRWIIWVW